MGEQLISSASPLAIGVVTLVSEQAFPNLGFLLHLAALHGNNLRFVGLYHTEDRLRSKEPADRLQKTLIRWAKQRGYRFQVELCQGSGRALDVRESLLAWMRQKTTVQRWVVNATLGMKPMSLALFETASAVSKIDARVMYLEMANQQWFEWRPGQDGMVLDEPLAFNDPERPPPDALDRLLPLDELAASQFALEGVQVTMEPDADLDHSPPILELARTSEADGHWNWGAVPALTELGKHRSAHGTSFERFIVEALRSMGFLAFRSLKARSAAGQYLAETDVVLVCNGRSYCLDLKLPDQEGDHEKGVQITKCAADARQFFGSYAVPILVRPGWQRSMTAAGAEQAKALGVRLLLQDDMRSLFTQLRDIINSKQPLSQDILDTEVWLHSLPHLSVFSHMGRIPGRMEGEIFPLSEVSDLVMQRHGQPWSLMRLHERRYLLMVQCDSLYPWMAKNATVPRARSIFDSELTHVLASVIGRNWGRRLPGIEAPRVYHLEMQSNKVAGLLSQGLREMRDRIASPAQRRLWQTPP